MATYTYLCEKCEVHTEIQQSIMDPLHAPRCFKCDSSKHMVRDYQVDIGYSIEGIKTIGSYADRNTQKISADEKKWIERKNKRDKESRPIHESLKPYKPGE